MKNLILIRHAKSSWKYPELDDFDRPLNNRGKRDAPIMGEHLAQQEIMPDLILSSPAKRAIKTAGIISQKTDFPLKNIIEDEKIYAASYSTLLSIIQQIEDGYESVLLIGHNPAITQLAVFLTNHLIENIPTCGVVSVTFETTAWKKVSEGTGTMKFFNYPKNL